MNEQPNKAHLVAFLALLLAFLAVILRMIGPYVLSLFMGATLSLLGYPLYLKLRRRLSQRLAAGAATVLILLLVIAPVAGFTALAVKQGAAVAGTLSKYEDIKPRALVETISRWRPVRAVFGDAQQVTARLQAAARTAGRSVSMALVRVAKGIPDIALQITLALIACFFFFLDGRRFVNWLLGLSALDRDVQEKLVGTFRDTANSTILASLIAAACQAAFLTFAFAVLRVPGSFLAGGATFILAWIPLVGSMPISLSGMAYLYLQEAYGRMAMMGVFALMTALIDNVVHTWVLRGRAGLHPLVGLVSIFGGIDMFGIMGVFVGPILAGMLLSLLELWPVIGSRFGIAVDGGARPERSSRLQRTVAHPR